jgi:hypothetical protein
MKKHRVLTEKAVNAKVVFRGVVVEIKKVSDQEVELTFPENVEMKELLSYLESFGVLKRKVVTPHLEPQLGERVDEIASEVQETQVGVENQEKEVKKEDLSEEKEQANESSQAEDTTTSSRRRKRKS